MVKRRQWSKSARVALFLKYEGRCHLCSQPIRGGWEVSHEIPLELGGADDDTNAKPAHATCHRQRTSTEDIPRISKAKRQQALHLRAKPKSWRWGYGRADKLKKKVTGEIILRDRK